MEKKMKFFCFTVILFLLCGEQVNFAENIGSSKSYLGSGSDLQIQESDIRGFGRTNMDRFIDDKSQELIKIRTHWKDEVAASVRFLETRVQGSGINN